jgi:signal transduction histidine kinase
LVQSEKLASLGRLAAGVAHELNNPLGVILGYVRLLGRKAEGELRDELRIVEDEAQRCQFIVEGLLELARPIRVDDAVVDLRALCLETVDRLEESGAAEGVEFVVEGEAKTRGTEHRLRQVVLNLASNGARAAGPGGTVRLLLDDTDGVASLRIRDTGPGVPVDLRGRLFEPFFTTRAEGTGLGLAVSRAIARAHGGDLALEDTAPPGATFSLHLPRATQGSPS